MTRTLHKINKIIIIYNYIYNTFTNILDNAIDSFNEITIWINIFLLTL